MDVASILDGFEAYNRAIRAAAIDTGAILVEGENEVPADEAHFADSVQFTDEGCRWQAQRILRGLEHSPAFQNLFAR
ncbi:MAG: hypothetical protein SGI72_06100 [Planctomycetota bacterium]|nr:hypothetical protein [Planctomycetota bacterium]